MEKNEKSVVGRILLTGSVSERRGLKELGQMKFKQEFIVHVSTQKEMDGMLFLVKSILSGEDIPEHLKVKPVFTKDAVKAPKAGKGKKVAVPEPVDDGITEVDFEDPEADAELSEMEKAKKEFVDSHPEPEE